MHDIPRYKIFLLFPHGSRFIETGEHFCTLKSAVRAAQHEQRLYSHYPDLAVWIAPIKATREDAMVQFVQWGRWKAIKAEAAAFWKNLDTSGFLIVHHN